MAPPHTYLKRLDKLEKALEALNARRERPVIRIICEADDDMNALIAAELERLAAAGVDTARIRWIIRRIVQPLDIARTNSEHGSMVH
jgi:hypothetical protein